MARAHQAEQMKQMRPTLLVGLGGTGQKVLVQLKARFIKNYGSVPRAVEFLAFDTDQAAEEASLDGKRIRLVAGTELINIGGVETAEIVQHLPRYPAMAAWMSEDKEKFPVRAITMGAQQVRPLGRLAFFWKVGDIYDALMSAVSRLTHLELEHERRGINVFVVTSVCGGTGSGIFLDMAYLIRHVVNQQGIRGSACFVNGILALPAVFPNVDGQGIRSNAFAALAELDYLTNNPVWTVDYGNPRVTNINFQAQRPFNICYFIDARNETGQGLKGLEEIAPMIGEAVYLQVGNQVGDANASAFDNVHTLGQTTTNVQTNEEQATAYSSFGTATLLFPAEKIREYCANRLGQEIISQELLQVANDQDEANKVLEEFIQANQLDADMLLEGLARDADGKAATITIDPRRLDNTDNKDLQRAVSLLAQRAESNLENQILPQMDNNQAAVRTALEAALAVEVNRLVDDPNYGLRFAELFLSKLDERLTTMRVQLGEQVADYENRSKRASAALRQTNQAFLDSFGGLPIGRGRRITESRDRHLAMVQEKLRSRFEIRRREVAVSALSAFTTASQRQRTRLQNTIDRLRFIQAQLQTTVEHIISDDTSYVLAQEITNRADMQQYYDHYKQSGADRPLVGLADEKGPISAWLDLEQEDISDRILDYTRGTFAPIQEIVVESVILEKDDDQGRKRLKDLIGRSVPFWSYREAGALGSDWKPEEIVVIGVNEKENSIFRNAVDRAGQLTSTFDKHQLVVLQTKHGLPLFALTQFKEYRDAHDRVLQKNLKPLYVLPEVRPGGHKAQQFFALGLVFGEIFRSGTFYYMKPENEVEKPLQLGQGMSTALQFFRSDEALIRSMEKRADTRAQKEGTQAAVDAIESWISTPYVLERKGGVANVEAQMTKDTTIGAMNFAASDLVEELRKAMQAYVRDILRG